jgi:hypothetical protein
LFCGSVFAYAPAPQSLDLVYDSGCFHHVPPHRRHQYMRLVGSALRPGAHLALVCFTPEGGSGYSDQEVYVRGSLGGGLGYPEHALRTLWGEYVDILILRRMREQLSGSTMFGKSYLWAMLGRKREA